MSVCLFACACITSLFFCRHVFISPYVPVFQSVSLPVSPLSFLPVCLSPRRCLCHLSWLVSVAKRIPWSRTELWNVESKLLSFEWSTRLNHQGSWWPLKYLAVTMTAFYLFVPLGYKEERNVTAVVISNLNHLYYVDLPHCLQWNLFHFFSRFYLISTDIYCRVIFRLSICIAFLIGMILGFAAL